MGRRRKRSGKVDEYLQEEPGFLTKDGRKKPWQPRGGQIPPNKVHKPRQRYDRGKERAWDWREHVESDE